MLRKDGAQHKCCATIKCPAAAFVPKPRSYQSPPGYFMFGSAAAERRTDAMNTRCSTRRQPVSRRIPGKQAWLLFFVFCSLLFASRPGVLAHRNPILLLRLSGLFLLRMAHATF
jgi:hypothetical protein